MKDIYEFGADADQEIDVHETISLGDGSHSGVIKGVVSRTSQQEYQYLDIYIDTVDDNKNEVTIKTGFPCYLSGSSTLGMFLSDAGLKFKPKDKITLKQIRDVLVDRKVCFQTFTEGQFANIINKTIKFEG